MSRTLTGSTIVSWVPVSLDPEMYLAIWLWSSFVATTMTEAVVRGVIFTVGAFAYILCRTWERASALPLGRGVGLHFQIAAGDDRLAW